MSADRRPTAAQAETLSVLADADTYLMFEHSYYPRSWVIKKHRCGIIDVVRAGTARAIIRRPWVRQEGAWYLLTEAGRAALAASAGPGTEEG